MLKPKKERKCKHKWTIIPYTPVITVFSTASSGGSGGILNDAIAVCTKCLEKRYL